MPSRPSSAMVRVMKLATTSPYPRAERKSFEPLGKDVDPQWFAFLASQQVGNQHSPFVGSDPGESPWVSWRLGRLDSRSDDGLALTMVVEAVDPPEQVPLRGPMGRRLGAQTATSGERCRRRSAHSQAVSMEVHDGWMDQATWASFCSHQWRSNSAGGRLSLSPHVTAHTAVFDG